MKYYKGLFTGKGFITHNDSKNYTILEYGTNIFYTDSPDWASKHNLEEITKEEAQQILDDYITEQIQQITDYDTTDEDERPAYIVLP